jgi:hypothetical protein
MLIYHELKQGLLQQLQAYFLHCILEKEQQFFLQLMDRLVFSKSDRGSVLPGAKIIGTGRYKGYVVKIFYFAPERNF